MKKIFSIVVASLLITAVNAQVKNDPNAEVREAKNYHGIDVSSAFDVYLSQSDMETVAVSAESAKTMEKITVEVKNGILKIGLKKEGLFNKGDKKLKAYISFKKIDQLRISGACDVYISDKITADELEIDQSGASDLSGKIEVNKLSVELSGASDIKLNGTATQLHIRASGASKFKGFDLVTETCHAKASGASDINVTVNKEISAEASGASDVRFKGSGVIKELKNNGASSVSKS